VQHQSNCKTSVWPLPRLPRSGDHVRSIATGNQRRDVKRTTSGAKP
jgi:hypothetical protein